MELLNKIKHIFNTKRLNKPIYIVSLIPYDWYLFNKNKINNKVYIGSSINIVRRFKKHKTDLKCQRHCNTYLQKSWNKYGKSVFEFSVLEELSNTEKMYEIELNYISIYNSLNRNFGYNLTLPKIHPTLTCDKKYLENLSLAKKGIKPDNFKDMLKIRWKKVRVFKYRIFYREYNSYNEAERDLNIRKTTYTATLIVKKFLEGRTQNMILKK